MHDGDDDDGSVYLGLLEHSRNCPKQATSIIVFTFHNDPMR